MGYAGWGPGQLQGEIVSGSWLHTEATPELVFDCAADELWRAAMRSLGVDPGQLGPVKGVH
jgi:putative transcriptional regulator